MVFSFLFSHYFSGHNFCNCLKSQKVTFKNLFDLFLDERLTMTAFYFLKDWTILIMCAAVSVFISISISGHPVFQNVSVDTGLTLSIVITTGVALKASFSYKNMCDAEV